MTLPSFQNIITSHTVLYILQEVAVKIIDLKGKNSGDVDEISKEIAIMRTLDHPNVVKVHCAFVVERDLWIVMPLFDGSCSRFLFFCSL